ncbi:CIC11C00000003125 [Sungouiella intermedia]|uniref:Protein DOM34 homolog n=1 Tax=Sungouiella intermedia TaxID=45354 RepID=A0A1L0BBV6_9ASCO|nr:CIC11C00000003125 [[Candida] intermedia]SGZ48926.1 CIC11C00000001060 [[Candida] intermedia]
MKLLDKTIALEKDKSGSLSLIPQDKEDLWQLYNLIQKGDVVDLSTLRNVKKTEGGKAERVHVRLKLAVESVDYAPSDETMRIRGKTTEQNEYVPNQSYHTAEVQLNKKITINKPEWDDISYGIVIEASSIEKKAEVGAVVLEEGVAHLCLVTDTMTVLRNKIEKSIPRKSRGDGGGSAHDKSMDKFLSMVLATVTRNFDLEKLKVVILASPGFTAGSLLKTILDDAVKEDNKSVIKNKSKFLVVHSSTGYLQGLEEVLKDPTVQRSLNDTKFAREAAVFEEFQKVLNEDDDRAWYGPKEVAKAVELGAVKYLLLTDSLFRSDDIAVRKHYIALSNQTKEQGGEVFIFSTLHESGEQLDQLTGSAVLLKYPMDLDEDEDEDDE